MYTQQDHTKVWRLAFCRKFADKYDMSKARFRYSLLIVLLGCALFKPHFSNAQDFQPPRPPPLDPATDFEDMEEDMMEMGDEGFRPPPPPQTGTPAPPPPQDFRPPANGSSFGGPGNAKKIFKIVDGEYWEKGKKRTRGTKVRGQSSPN